MTAESVLAGVLAGMGRLVSAVVGGVVDGMVGRAPAYDSGQGGYGMPRGQVSTTCGRCRMNIPLNAVVCPYCQRNPSCRGDVA